MKHLRWLILLLLMLSWVANAAPTSGVGSPSSLPPATTSPGFSLPPATTPFSWGTSFSWAWANSNSNFKASVVTAINALHTSGINLAPMLVSTGTDLLWVFFAIMFAWNVIEGMLAQQLDVMFKNIIRQILISAIALELLLGWTDGSKLGVAGFLTSGMEQLNTPFYAAGVNNPVNQVIDAYWGAVVNLVKIIPNMWSIATVGGPPGGQTWIDSMLNGIKVYAEVTLQSITNPVLFWGLLIFFVVLVLVVVLSCALTLLLAMVYSLLFINLGDFIIYIGLAVGPIFVATLAFPPATHYFNKWLEFVISGGIYKLIAVVMAALMTPIFANLQTQSANVVGIDSGWFWEVGKNIGGFTIYGFIMMFWSVLAYFMTKQIPVIVHSLSSGIAIHPGSLGSMPPAFMQKAAQLPAALLKKTPPVAAAVELEHLAHGDKHSSRSLTAMAGKSPSVGMVIDKIKAIRKAADKAAKLNAKNNPSPSDDETDEG